MAPKRKLSLQTYAAPTVLSDAPAFAAALDALALQDGAFMAILDAICERPSLRRREPGFEGLAGIIVAQQVSTASANAIFGRLKDRLCTVDATTLEATPDADLKACGLSAQKIRTLRAIAAAVGDGTLDFAALATAEAETAQAFLCAIKGVGPWTADVFLLFCLGHSDAWPAGDLALQEAARLALGLHTRPSTRELQALGERWRPLRWVAAHSLWAYYRAARLRPATLEISPAKPAPKPNRKPSRNPRETKRNP